MTCPDCQGQGKITLLTSTEPCARCEGAGEVPRPVSNEEFFSGSIAQHVETDMTIPKKDPEPASFIANSVADQVLTTEGMKFAGFADPEKVAQAAHDASFRPEGKLGKLRDFHLATIQTPTTEAERAFVAELHRKTNEIMMKNAGEKRQEAMKDRRPEFSEVEGFWLVSVTMAGSPTKKLSLCEPKRLAGASTVFHPDHTVSYDVEGKLDGVDQYWTITADEVRANNMSIRESVKQRIIKYRESHPVNRTSSTLKLGWFNGVYDCLAVLRQIRVDHLSEYQEYEVLKIAIAAVANMEYPTQMTSQFPPKPTSEQGQVESKDKLPG